MKRSEVILWIMVAVALAANIWLPRHLRQKYSWDRDLSQRLAADFCKTRGEVKEEIRKFYPYVSDEQIDSWTSSGKLESMEIGRRMMYFRDAAANLPLLVPELAPTTPSVPSTSSGTGEANSVTVRVRFSITIPKGTLRPGTTVRCWLPYPRQDIARQTDVKLIEAGADSVAFPSERITFSNPSCAHSSIYMEARTSRYHDLTFHEVFEYSSTGETRTIDPGLVLPYDTSSEEYVTYTSGREKHVVFTERIQSLADSLTEGITNPYLQARAFFTWIDGNIPWASAREYSTIENIPEYVLSAGHGDCGQKTLLFMTLCRYKGIPVRWQSGLAPQDVQGRHLVWCEASFEGYGWVPVDQSFGAGVDGGCFYLGSIDPNRLVFNNDFGRELSPAKKYPRSDDVDFQRGEVEWDGGNLYYTQWSHNIDIEYL